MKGSDGPTSDRAKAEAVCAKYPPIREATCYVDPAKPELGRARARDESGTLHHVVSPAFVAGGAGMISSAWRKKIQNTNYK